MLTYEIYSTIGGRYAVRHCASGATLCVSIAAGMPGRCHASDAREEILDREDGH